MVFRDGVIKEIKVIVKEIIKIKKSYLKDSLS